MKKSHRKEYKKHYLPIILFSLIVISSFFVVSYLNQIPSPGHGGDQIFFSNGSAYFSLQEAISNGTIKGPPMLLGTLANTSLTGLGHMADNIWIKLNGNESTLQDAINNGSLCCSSCTGDSVYAQQISSLTHYASKIWIINKTGNEETLQKAIDNKEFCSCGDSFCDSARGETCSTCPGDCGSCCGNTACDNGETCATCPGDCGNCCGNGVCDNGETCGTCDCPACPCVVNSCPCDNFNNCGTYYCGNCYDWYDPGGW